MFRLNPERRTEKASNRIAEDPASNLSPLIEKGEQKANREPLRLETNVTHTKQTHELSSNREKDAVFHPAAPAANAPPRNQKGEQKANREWIRLEFIVTHRKQKPESISNREKVAVFHPANPAPEAAGRNQKGEQKANRESLRLEINVTHTKQKPDLISNREKEAVFHPVDPAQMPSRTTLISTAAGLAPTYRAGTRRNQPQMSSPRLALRAGSCANTPAPRSPAQSARESRRRRAPFRNTSPAPRYKSDGGQNHKGPSAPVDAPRRCAPRHSNFFPSGGAPTRRTKQTRPESLAQRRRSTDSREEIAASNRERETRATTTLRSPGSNAIAATRPIPHFSSVHCPSRQCSSKSKTHTPAPQRSTCWRPTRCARGIAPCPSSASAARRSRRPPRRPLKFSPVFSRCWSFMASLSAGADRFATA